jgi:hypothetical protein
MRPDATPPDAAGREPVEAREVPPWRPDAGPLRTRTWTRGEPAVEVYVKGRWRPARVMQRQDRLSGEISVHVTAHLEVGNTYRAYAWDSRSIRPVRPATADPIVRDWP